MRANLLHGWYIDCCEYYADAFRRSPSVGIRRDIANIILGGMTADCLNALMDEAQRAYHPSWNYCMAIVRRCQNEGIRTLGEWLENKRRREAERNPALRFSERAYQDGDFGPNFFARAARSTARKNPALDYDQREYREEDFGEGFYVDLSKYDQEGGARDE